MPIDREEPWRCTSCGELMFNCDAQGPAAGAPMPHFWSLEHNEVCSVCYAMVLLLATNDYWKALHEADREEAARRKDQNERLSGKRDYFTGF